MTARVGIHRSSAMWGAGAAVVGLIVAALIDPKSAAAGWLIGFLFWSQILIGSLVLAMIHRLTSGRWGEIIAPVLMPTVAAVPFLLLLVIPVLAAIPQLFPWAGAAPTVQPDVASYYLNVPFFILRTIVALTGWTALATLMQRSERRDGQLLAAFGLVFHCVVISSVAIDWYLSPEAPFTSSSFGASVAITQLIAALAWAALLTGKTEVDVAMGDVGALLLAFVLGITYVDFMAVLVIWYGDLPHESIWFVERERLPWLLLAVGAFILVSVAPILLLLLERVRNSGVLLRAVAAVVLVGLALYDAYLIAPPFGVATLVPGLLAVIGIGLAGLMVAKQAPAGFFNDGRSARVP